MGVGVYIAYGICLVCRRGFSFNPHYVPSLTIEGHREPICGDCMKLVNEKRKELGAKELPINPKAYEPEGEDEFEAAEGFND